MLAWHRKLVAAKGDGSSKRVPGRPRTRAEVEALIVRMAEENRTWGFDRIVGALANLGHTVSPHTVANILKRHGIDPAPERERKTTWKEFVSRHFDQIAAKTFSPGGIAKCPNGFWMEQVGRNITDCEDGILKTKRFLIQDRDPLYTDKFLKILAQSGVDPVKLPAAFLNLSHQC